MYTNPEVNKNVLETQVIKSFAIQFLLYLIKLIKQRIELCSFNKKRELKHEKLMKPSPICKCTELDKNYTCF